MGGIENVSNPRECAAAEQVGKIAVEIGEVVESLEEREAISEDSQCPPAPGGTELTKFFLHSRFQSPQAGIVFSYMV